MGSHSEGRMKVTPQNTPRPPNYIDTPLVANIIVSVTSKDVEISTENKEFMDVMD